MTPRPPMLGETPLSPAEIAYLTHDHELPDTVSTAIYQHDIGNSESGQSLCELVDTPFFGARPVPTLGFKGFGNDRARAQEDAKYLMVAHG